MEAMNFKWRIDKFSTGKKTLNIHPVPVPKQAVENEIM